MQCRSVVTCLVQRQLVGEETFLGISHYSVECNMGRLALTHYNLTYKKKPITLNGNIDSTGTGTSELRLISYERFYDALHVHRATAR